MGDVKPWLWGKTHVLSPLLFVTFGLIQPLSTSLMLQLVDGQLLLKCWWLWQVVSLTHFATPPTFAILHPHALFPGQFLHSHHDFGLLALTQGFLGRFWSHAGLHSPISRPPCRWLIFTWEIAVRWSLTHRKFLALSTWFFFCGFVHSEAVSFLTG